MATPSTKSYPTLEEMGVRTFLQIDNYYITSINRIDLLRIVYSRPKDSLLPSSRTYRFPQIPDDSGSGAMRINPKLRAALDELAVVMEAKKRKQDIAGELLKEIAILEEDIALRSEYMKELVKKIPIADC